MITPDDITLYNKYIENRAEKYQRTVLRGVNWQDTKSVNGSHSGLLASNVATIFIPFSLGTQYARPLDWILSKSGKWTLKEGDVIVRGVVEDEIADAVTDPDTDEVTPAFTMTSLRAKYDDVVTITSVDRMDIGSDYMKHWEVGAR